MGTRTDPQQLVEFLREYDAEGYRKYGIRWLLAREKGRDHVRWLIRRAKIRNWIRHVPQMLRIQLRRAWRKVW
jgi:hypothetical protein